MEESFVFIIVGIGVVVFAFGAYLYKNIFVPRRIEEIDTMIQAGNTALAIKQLKTMLEQDERNPYVHFLLGEAYFKEKNAQYAISEFKQVIKLGKFDSKVREELARSRLARIYKDSRQLEDAKKEYLILTKIDPNNFENFYQVGTIFFNSGAHDKALPFLRQAAKINPRHADALYLVGQIHYLMNQLGEAKGALIECTKLKPTHYKAHYFLGMSLRGLKDYEWAVQEFELAQKDPDVQQKACLARGTCYLEKDQVPRAIVEFEKGLKAVKREIETELNLRYFLAMCAERNRDLHTAIQQWERICDARPNFRDVKEKLKQYEEFRTDDSIKDFMIASPGKFEETTRRLIEAMGMQITDLTVLTDTLIEVLATEMDNKRRNSKKNNQLYLVIRSTDSVPESSVRKLQEDMREKGANRGTILTTGEFTPGAMEFSQSRPIDLLDKSQMIRLLRTIDTGA